MIGRALSAAALITGVGVAASPDKLVEPYFDTLRDRAAVCAEWLGPASMASLTLTEDCQEFSSILRVSAAETVEFKNEHPYSEAKPPKYRSESGQAFLKEAHKLIGKREDAGRFAVRGLVSALGGLWLLAKAQRRQARSLQVEESD